MDVKTIVIVSCFAAIIIAIAIVVIMFLILGKKLESDYVKQLAGKDQLLEAMDKDTIFERMVRGGRVLQYITILGAFTAVFFLAILGQISAEIAATIIGMIITGVIGAEAGARVPGGTRRESQQPPKGSGEDSGSEQ